VTFFLVLGLLVPDFGPLYFTAVAVIGAMLIYEQSLVTASDFSRIDAAFFNINGAISVVFFGIVLAERLLA
jgi:4-hydroxybenzoate polyprenyltransferase